MSADVLSQLIQQVRRQLPEVPAEVWRQLEVSIRSEYGGDRHWIGRHGKATMLSRLEAASQADGETSSEQLAKQLGCSVRYIQKLKRLRGG